MDDGVDGELDIGGVVENDRGVAGADAQGGLARRICSLDHAGAAGGQDDVDIAHDHVGEVDGGNIDPADDLLGSAGLDGGVEDELGCGDGALRCSGVRADDDGVAGLQRDEALEDRGRGGVGGGDDGANQADGLGDLGDAEGLVALDNAAGLGVLVGVVDVLGGVVILDHLVLEDAAAGLLDSHAGQRDAGLVGCHGGLIEDFVYLLLRIRSKNPLGLAHARELRLKGFNRIYDLGCRVDDRFLCHSALLKRWPYPTIRIIAISFVKRALNGEILTSEAFQITNTAQFYGACQRCCRCSSALVGAFTLYFFP